MDRRNSISTQRSNVSMHPGCRFSRRTHGHVGLAPIVAVLAFAILQASPALGQSNFDDKGLARQMLEKHIRPGYAAFAAKAQGLRATLEAACKAPSKAEADKARAVFRDAVLAWSRMEHVRFGPVVEGNRLERIMFWPDRQRIGERQVGQILDKKDPGALAVGDLQKKSAAVQGLTALELLLVNRAEVLWSATPDGQFACGYATAIAGNLETMAREIAAGWAESGAYAGLWLNPGDANPAYKTPGATSLDALKAYRFGLNHVRDGKLLGALGQKRTRPDGPFAPKARAPFDPSGLAVAAMRSNIEGIQDLYEAGGLAERMAPVEPDRADLIRNTLAETVDILGAVEKTGDAPLNAAGEAALGKAPQAIAAAYRLGGDALEVVVTGAVLGFKEDDGD